MYTLVPLLYQRGITKLDIICTKPSTTTFRALTTLVDTMPVKKVYLPRWKGTLKNSGWSAWEKLLSISIKYGTSILYVDKPVAIPIGQQAIEIRIRDKVTRKNMMRYKTLYF